MLFGLFAKKDHRHYIAQAGKYLAAERYADARIDFEEALKRCPADAETDRKEIVAGLEGAKNRLAEMNVEEGEYAMRGGEVAKARDHFLLAGDLAVDPSIKRRAGEGLKRLSHQASPSAAPARQGLSAHGGSCGSCGTGSRHETEEPLPDSDFDDEIQFTLLTQPLPGDLPARYAALGHDFARAYLMIHDGRDNEALPVLEKMLASAENDIVIYEVALIMFRKGRIHECETLLKRALSLNSTNGACYLALVHLLAGSERFPEALATTRHMVKQGILADQAQFMLGDLEQAAGNDAAAMDEWSKALQMPGVARAAAERLVPMLAAQGRHKEAKHLAKSYLKGCH